MHLFKKWSEYAFIYSSMQMHNYPKPNYDLSFVQIHYALYKFLKSYSMFMNVIALRN